MNKLWCLLMLPVTVLAAELPANFEGLRWGAPVAELPDARKLAETSRFQCYRSGEGLTRIGDTPVSNLRLCFSNDRFYFVQMEFGGQAAHAALLAHGRRVWGEAQPVRRGDETHSWGGGDADVYIELEFSRLDDRGTLAFVYLPVFRDTQQPAGR